MESVISQAATLGPYAIATPSAKEAVLVANTPSFLLDRLRRDVAVQNVMDNMSVMEVLHALRQGLSNPPSDVIELVPLYVYLAALSNIDPQKTDLWKEFLSLDLSKLEWGDAIRARICADAIPTTTLDFTLPAPLHP